MIINQDGGENDREQGRNRKADEGADGFAFAGSKGILSGKPRDHEQSGV